MPGVGSKKSLAQLFFNKIVLAVIVIACLFVAKSVYERYLVEREIAVGRYEAEAEYEELLERRDTLLERVEYLKGDSGRESEIRKHFDVAREGEQVVIIVDEENGETTELTEGIDPRVAPAAPWWQFWR